MEILIGADPEVFVKQNGIFLSGHNLIKGDKQNPFPVENGAVQVDGMALEFNISPSKTQEEFLDNIQSVYSTLRSMVPEYEVVATPVADFSQEYMDSLPKESLILGCDPDFNAWMGGAENIKPDGNRPMRTAAGHVHIGWTKDKDINDEEHKQSCCTVIKQMDYFLGLPSLLFDTDTRRRGMYGKPGCFRPKSYGAEYRVLSNAWLNKPEWISWVFNNAKLAMEQLYSGKNLVKIYGDIQEIITTSSADEAKRIIIDAKIPIPEGI